MQSDTAPMPEVSNADRTTQSAIRGAIGRRLRIERERLGLTQQALANELGIQRQALLLYESGERSPSADKLCELDRLGGDVAFVVTGRRPELLTLTGERELELAMSAVVLMCRRPGTQVDEVTKLRLALRLAETMHRSRELGFDEADALETLRASIDSVSG